MNENFIHFDCCICGKDISIYHNSIEEIDGSTVYCPGCGCRLIVLRNNIFLYERGVTELTYGLIRNEWETCVS